VWFHQPVGVVDESGGSVPVESRFARILGLRLRRMPRYHGSAVTWENTTYPGTAAFVVELPRRVSASLDEGFACPARPGALTALVEESYLICPERRCDG
jgi:hypothetical protein